MPQVASVSPGKGETAIPNAPHCTLVVITIPAGLPNVYSLDGRYLGREGAQTNPLPARRLRQLLLERGAVQFEDTAASGCIHR